MCLHVESGDVSVGKKCFALCTVVAGQFFSFGSQDFLHVFVFVLVFVCFLVSLFAFLGFLGSLVFLGFFVFTFQVQVVNRDDFKLQNLLMEEKMIFSSTMAMITLVWVV